MSIKVLHVLVCLGGGGVETLLLNLQEKLPEYITFDYLVTCPDIRDHEAQQMGSKIHEIPKNMQHPTRWAALVGQLVQEYGYDVVHYHRFAFSGNVLKKAKQAGAKIRIAHSHGTHMLMHETSFLKRVLYNPYHWIINRRHLAHHATHIVGCSSDALRHLIGSFENRPKCRVILNGIPVDDFAEKMGIASKAELCRRYGIPTNAFVIGTFGRLESVKNHEFLLRIFYTIVKRNRLKNVVLFIGGDGQYRSQLESDRLALGLQDKVFLPGHCPQVPELLANLFDCFVLPSKAEGLPVSMVEAVATGLYVVYADTITKDVEKVFPNRVSSLPLSASLDTWAEAVEKAVPQRILPVQGLELVRNSPMNFDYFVNQIIRMYEEG